MTWTRHDPATTWCLVVAIRDSVITACNGRFPVEDRYEVAGAIPHDLRCDACERARVDRVFVERGLRDLVEASAPIVEMLDTARADGEWWHTRARVLADELRAARKLIAGSDAAPAPDALAHHVVGCRCAACIDQRFDRSCGTRDARGASE